MEEKAEPLELSHTFVETPTVMTTLESVVRVY